MNRRLDTQALLRVLWRSKVAVLLILFCAIGASVAAVALATPQYVSTVQLFVAADNNAVTANAQGAYEATLFGQQSVQSYVDVIRNTPVTSRVIADLDLPYSPSDLASHISAVAPANTVLIDVSVRDTSPRRAQSIANSLAASFISFVGRLEKVAHHSSPVTVRISQPASFPTAPSSPRKALDIGLGFLIGLVLVLAYGATRFFTDTLVRDAALLSEATASPILAMIPFDKTVPSMRLGVTSAEGHTPRAEAYRYLRTNLQFISVDRPVKTLVITSPHGGDGKTMTAVNLAAVCSGAGMKVLLVDADLRRPRLTALLDLGVRSAGLTGYLSESGDIGDYIQTGGTELPCDVLLNGIIPPNPSELLASAKMRALVDVMSVQYDLILFDAPPLLPVTDAAVLSAFCDGVLLVVRHSVSRYPDVRRAHDSLAAVSARIMGVVLNAVPASEREGHYYYYHTPQDVVAG